MWKPKKLKHKNKWIAVIPAHNEQAVIENITYDCKQNHIDKIYVILDSCTDSTETLCKYHGVTTIKVNYHSKTKSLNHILPIIASKLNDNDYIFLFDADNRLPHNFYKKLLNYPIVQTRIKSKNYTNPISNYYTFCLSYAQRVQTLLNNLHLSTILAGTGYYLKAKIIKKNGFNVSTLVDDMEYSAIISERVYYDANNFVYNEQPTNLRASTVQILRWLRGGYQILFTKTFKTKLNKLHILAFPLLNLYSIINIALRYKIYYVQYTSITLIITFIFTSAYWLILLYKSDFKYIRIIDLFYLFFFNYFILIPLNIFALLTFRNYNWIRTKHKIKSYT